MKIKKCVCLFIVLFMVGIGSGYSKNLKPVESTSPGEKMTVAVLGDLLFSRKISAQREPGFLKLVDLVRGVDCAWGNCELPLVDIRDLSPQFREEDLPGNIEPWGADEMKWLGIDCVGLANNHTMDYGNEGLFSTLSNLDRVGIGYAGAGKDLEFASRPGYVDVPGGRIGTVNFSSTIHPGTFASLPHPYMRGRPGLNPLRADSYFKIDRQSFDVLKKIEGDILKYFDIKEEEQDKIKKDEVKLGYDTYVVGDKFDFYPVMNENDRKRIVESVKMARRSSRIVIASIHSHDGRLKDTAPAEYIEKFAKECIDAGADTFVGTGPHRLWGIEIYKNKPIFYSIGNFFFQITATPYSAEKYDEYGIKPDTRDPMEFYDKIIKKYFKDNYIWEGVVPVTTFGKENEVIEIKLYPVVLGKDAPIYMQGLPQLAGETEAKSIIEGLKKSSEVYKTKIEYEGGIGIIRLK